MSKHTPWTYQPNLLTPRFWSIMDATGSVVVAEVEGTEDLVSSIAHAVNCHADLLEACKEFVRKVEAGEARSTRSYEQMKAAIAKATP